MRAYETLQIVLNDAFDQAANGKGKERHGNTGLPFHEQRMQTISQLLATDQGMAFQAIKKLTEGLELPDRGARERELLGAIVYIAGIVVYHRAIENEVDNFLHGTEQSPPHYGMFDTAQIVEDRDPLEAEVELIRRERREENL